MVRGTIKALFGDGSDNQISVPKIPKNAICLVLLAFAVQPNKSVRLQCFCRQW
jgi:hypothetical protein